MDGWTERACFLSGRMKTQIDTRGGGGETTLRARINLMARQIPRRNHVPMTVMWSAWTHTFSGNLSPSEDAGKIARFQSRRPHISLSTPARPLRPCERTSGGAVRMWSSRAPRRVFHGGHPRGSASDGLLFSGRVRNDVEGGEMLRNAAAVQTRVPAACPGVNVRSSLDQLLLLPGALCSAHAAFHAADTRSNPNLGAAWNVLVRRRHLWRSVTVNYFSNLGAPGVTVSCFCHTSAGLQMANVMMSLTPFLVCFSGILASPPPPLPESCTSVVLELL